MENKKSLLGFIGIAIGSVSLLLALFHFYAGPFAPQPTLEDTVAEKAAAIRNATISALKGEEPKKKTMKFEMDSDKLIQITVSLLGGIAIILGVVGFATKESSRVAGGATVLGIGAIAFQFLTVALGALIVVILIAVVLNQIGIDL
ncbi:MAG: hypothetical protein AAF419_04595 [Pseudomonadota bacterium]